MDPLDLDQFRLPPEVTAPPRPKRKPPRYCREEFLRGPIPWPWLVKAMALPGRALAVTLALWREVGMRDSLTVPFSHARMRQCGILPDASRRALRNLEGAGLVSVRRRPGCRLEVTLLQAPAPEAERNGRH